MIESQTGRGPVQVFYISATGRYRHGVLGDAVEAGGLAVRTRENIDGGGCGAALMLPEDAVFEDTNPRLADLDRDGVNEVVVVESSLRLGAQLAIYGLRDGALRKVAATAHIGQPFRWLAPVGIADFDGDGQNDVAYVETPHLGKTLRIVTMREGRLAEIAALRGLSNHRIGDREISGGIRRCRGVVEAITANGDWTRVYAARLEGGKPVTEDAGPRRDAGDFEDALACR